MTTVGERNEVAHALAALKDSASRQTDISCLGSDIQRAASAGASWHQIAEAIGIDREEIWARLGQEVRSAILRNASSADALSEAEAMELAVAETKVVRKKHARERSLRSRHSGPSR